MLEKIDIALSRIKQTKPLVLNLTNYVTMDFMANVLLAIGAAPMMLSIEHEVEELIAMAHAVNINIGSLDASFIDKANTCVKIAKHYGKPIVLDPVGAGASGMRTKIALQLIKDVSIIRGNASEIMALSKSCVRTFGVESTHSVEAVKRNAIELANRDSVTVVVSGPVDFITDSQDELDIPYGSCLMTRVTGMGCALTAVIAAFTTVIENKLEAARLATAYFGLCGQLSATKADKPGSFRSIFIDELYASDLDSMKVFI